MRHGGQGGAPATRSATRDGGEARAESLAREFLTQGFVVLGSALSTDQAADLQRLVEHRYQHLSRCSSSDGDLIRGGISLMRVFEADQAFRDLLVLDPVLDLVERILGPDCHLVAQNALRTPRASGIVNWHIDDAMFFPFLADVEWTGRQAPQVPCYSLNVLVALSDVDADEFGPTQVVAGSHLSGREPIHAPSLPPHIKATSLLTRAGDAFLVNSQTWHRGAQNRTDRVRYMVTATYGRRFIAQRFFPFLNYRVPDHVLDGASDTLLRLLGKHDKGPYG